MPALRRHSFQSPCDERLYLPIGDLARSAGPRFIGQSVQTSRAKPLPPLANSLICNAELPGDLGDSPSRPRTLARFALVGPNVARFSDAAPIPEASFDPLRSRQSAWSFGPCSLDSRRSQHVSFLC